MDDFTNDYGSIDYGSVGGGFDAPTATSSGDQEFLDFMTGAAGDLEFEKFMTDAAATGQSNDVLKELSDLAKSAGTAGFDALKKVFQKKDKDGKVLVDANNEPLTDWAALATAGVGLYSSLAPKSGAVSNQKPIPVLTASRQQVQYDDPNRQPGAQGRQYFTDTKYDGTSGDAQSQGILAAYQPAAPTVNPYAGQMPMNYNRTPMPATAAVNPASSVAQTMPVPNPANQMAHGGITELARGGRYLSGSTDGMEDKIPSSIDGKQPAALSHGEFVIPADVVSHLGNGNSDAGANKLYEMMARIRKARTGNPKQGKQINANNFMPGGLATYSGGGGVMGFNGKSTSIVPDASLGSSGTTGGGVPADKTTTQTLAPYASDYITTAIGQGGAAADAPYQAYKGPLTAGASNLQQQAFAGASDVAKGGFNPTTFTSNTFGSEQAQQYMNPYLKNVLDPQMAELKRQSDIQQLQNNAAATKAGAFGGGRQALMNSETNRNLLNAQNVALGQGYSNAYDKAMGQFNTDQGRGMEAQKATEASRQYSSDFGLKSLADLSQQGAIQRGITSEGLAADKTQFEEQRDYPMKAAQYKLNLLQGIPVGSQTTSSDPGALANLTSQISGLGGLYKLLANLGVTK